MRILVINWQDWTHPFAGGAEIHLREVFGRIADAGHRVDLLCVAHGEAAGEERLAGINVLRRGGAYTLFNYAVPGLWRRLLRRHPYDVVVDDLNKVPFFTPLFIDRPVVALVHHLFGRAVFEEVNPLFASYVWTSERPIAAVYRRCPFIAVSQSTADDLTARGVPPERITVVHNGLPDLDDEVLLARPKASHPLFVYVGRLKRYKRIDLVLDAFARLAPEHPAAQLVVAGDGDHREALERHAARIEGAERIRFTGWLEDDAKWALLREAWALCYTSPKEGWGFGSLEAQRVGTIAIVSDAPGLRDTIVPGETGVAVPHGDVAALAEAMADAIRRPAEREEREAAAVRWASGFSWDTAARETLAVLERAVEDG